MRHLIAALACMLATSALAEDRTTLSVTGSGVATAAPDMAVVTIGVVESAADASSAMDRVSDGVSRLLAAISEVGVDDRDVQTTGLSVSPRYAPPRPNQTGPRVEMYQAANSVTIRVRDLDLLGPLLGDLMGKGANALNGLRFDVADPAPLEATAERLAVEDAARTARNLAAAAGLTLGPILSMSEGGQIGGGMPVMRSFEMAESAAVPVAGGEVSRAASVSIVYELLD